MHTALLHLSNRVYQDICNATVADDNIHSSYVTSLKVDGCMLPTDIVTIPAPTAIAR